MAEPSVTPTQLAQFASMPFTSPKIHPLRECDHSEKPVVAMMAQLFPFLTGCVRRDSIQARCNSRWFHRLCHSIDWPIGKNCRPARGLLVE
jgi:hypothetical protein